MPTSGRPHWTTRAGWTGSCRSSTHPAHRTRQSSSCPSAANPCPSASGSGHEVDAGLPVPAAGTRTRGGRTGRRRPGGAVPHPRRHRLRHRQPRPGQRRGRAGARHRRYPGRGADRGVADAQAGVRPAHRRLPGRAGRTGAGVPGTAARRGGGSGSRAMTTVVDGLEPLAGFTIGVTADRRRDELSALLERRGARVVLAPALRIVPLADDSELRAATLSCVDDPPDIVIATTGIGLRGWLEAAEGWGLAEALRSRLAASYLIARGPKARGAVRAAGLVDAWSPDSESCDEVLDHLLGDAFPNGIAGRRVAIQLHGEAQPEFCASIRMAGADVVEVPV